MQIFLDGDACPGAVKEIVFRAADRRKISTTLVANMTIRIPKSDYITCVTVRDGADVADREIVKRVSANDLVITADVPLAAAVVAKGAIAVDPRGQLYSDASIGERLAVRNLMDELRGGDFIGGGPKPYSVSDKQAFANQLDRLLAKAR